jgi:hypothetical protein
LASAFCGHAARPNKTQNYTQKLTLSLYELVMKIPRLRRLADKRDFFVLESKPVTEGRADAEVRVSVAGLGEQPAPDLVAMGDEPDAARI